MIDKRKIYGVKIPEFGTELLAMYVTIDYAGKKCVSFYEPGARGHLFEGEVKEETEDGFIFLRDYHGEKEEWKFTEVTYENFKSKYINSVIHGEEVLEKVSNTKELQDYYYTTFAVEGIE